MTKSNRRFMWWVMKRSSFALGALSGMVLWGVVISKLSPLAGFISSAILFFSLVCTAVYLVEQDFNARRDND